MTELDKLAQQEKQRIENIRNRIKSLTEEIQQKKESTSAQLLNLKQPSEIANVASSPSLFSEIQNMLLETIIKGYEAIIQEKEKIIQKLQKEIDNVIEKHEQLKLIQEQQIARISALSQQQDKSLLELVKKIAELESENKNLKIKIQELKQHSGELSKSLQQDKIEYVISHMKLLTFAMKECIRYFRNPIGMINEALELVKEDVDGHPCNKKVLLVQQELFKIRDILNSAIQRLRISSVNLQTINLKSLITTVLSKFQNDFLNKNIEVIQETTTPQEEINITGDLQILVEILSEIITNSIESFLAPTGNKIIIRINLVDNTPTLEIEDNGCGIPERLLPKVFDLFFTTKFEQGHYGIGLFKAYWYLKMFSAKISISSVYNRGTTVLIEFPQENK